MNQSTPNVNDTITLRDDGTSPKDMYIASPRDLPSQMYDDIGETRTHSISDFLSRYVIVAQGVWNTSASRGSVLQNLTFPKNLLQAPGYNVTQNINKLDGFVGLKACVRVRIEVNSQPYQAGALMLHYVPYSEYMQSHTQWYATSSATALTAASGCPNIVMNIANTTSMEFCTPYVSPYLFFNLPTGQGSFGNVVISVLSPLASTVASNCSYTIWAKFDEIDLRFPTDAPLTTNYAQIGTELSTLEQRGTISSTVGAIGRAASAVLPWVGLGWLSSPVASLADGSEKILKHLGFSKPTVEAPVRRVKNAPLQYMFNHDGADTSHKLGLSAENALTQFTGWAGTDIDEMRHDYVASKPCYMTSFSWAAGNPADTVLFSSFVSPLATQTLGTRVTNAYAIATTMPLCARVASFYSVWRGTMVYRFHVIKTQFHSGRIRISFRPYIYTDSTTIQNMPGYAYTEEVDLASGTDFTFKVPFVSVRPWLHTQFDPLLSLTSNDARNFATGTIQISVINPLVAASTVSTTVDTVVFVSMEDAQFAGPVNSIYLPYNIPNVAQIGGDEAQIGKPALVPTVVNSEAVSRADLSLLPYAACVGETVTSFRQLAKRFSLVAKVAVGTSWPASATTTGSNCNGFVIFPWAPVIPPSGTITVDGTGKMLPKWVNQYTFTPSTTATTIFQIQDTYSHLYSMYAFFRGSVRYKIVMTKAPDADVKGVLPIQVYITNIATPGTDNDAPPMETTPATGSTLTNLGTGPIQPLRDIPPQTATTLKTGFCYQPLLASANLVVDILKEGSIEFEVPFHSSGPFCPTNYGQNTPGNTRSIFYPYPIVTIVGPTPNGGLNTLAGAQFDVYRAVGDDFSFGGSLGAPPATVWLSTVDPQ